jgi:D-3-phosphoglycerate dehydrogenase
MKILVCDQISQDGIDLLRSSKAEFEYAPEISHDELATKISDFEAIIVRSRTRVTKDLLLRANRLRIVARAGVGVDNIDVEFAKERGIEVVNTPDALTNAVAEFTIGLMIDLSRSITNAATRLRNMEWKKAQFVGSELQGKVYGAIGVGRIGRRVIELAHAFGMKIIAHDIVEIPKEFTSSYEVEMTNQDEVFRRADFLDLHVPLTNETRHLVNREKIEMMKQSAFLVNTSRGQVIDEQALLVVLEKERIAGAALDVFETEPPTRESLLQNKRVIPTPHIAGQTLEAQSKAAISAVRQVLDFLSIKT